MDSDEEEELIADLIQDKVGIPDDALDIQDDQLQIPEDDALDVLDDVLDIEDDDYINDDLDDDYEQWLKEQKMQEWSIIYSKKPELIIDKDEYDKILINLL